MLTSVSLVLAALVAIPFGLVLERRRRWAEPLVRTTGVLQTIPGIALLAFMIPMLGIGTVPALVALFIYSLYPIVRNTYSGVRDADPVAVNAAHALGMTPGQVLRHVRLPSGGADDHGGRADGRSDQRRDGDAGGIHWRGRTRRADRHRVSRFPTRG